MEHSRQWSAAADDGLDAERIGERMKSKRVVWGSTYPCQVRKSSRRRCETRADSHTHVTMTDSTDAMARAENVFTLRSAWKMEPYSTM